MKNILNLQTKEVKRVTENTARKLVLGGRWFYTQKKTGEPGLSKSQGGDLSPRG